MKLKSRVSNFKFKISNLRSLPQPLRLAQGYLKFEISNLKWLWWWLRQVSGDAAYENYLRRMRSPAMSTARGPSFVRRPRDNRPADAHPPASQNACSGRHAAMSAQEFYLDQLARRYSGVSRCC